VSELIDTTEMYLKAVYELEEDGITPLRARIVERLDHSGPTVSQTVSRMERDGLIHVAEDRSLKLTYEGRRHATEVIRKHRLAERVLLDIIGLDRRLIHDEACRWEHVMSEKVEDHLFALLGEIESDPFGNPMPPSGIVYPSPAPDEICAESLAGDIDEVIDAVVARVGEPVQASHQLLVDMEDAGIVPKAQVQVMAVYRGVRVEGPGGDAVVLPRDLARHLFLRR